MSMQHNTIRCRHRGRMGNDNRATARERWSASLCMPLLAFPSCGPDPRYCVSDVQHPGQKATNRIDTLPQRFPLFAGSLAQEAVTAIQLQQRMAAQPLLMKVPSRSSPAACRSSACVFITIGPYQAMGSRSGFPETSRNRIPSSLAWTVTSSPGRRERASDYRCARGSGLRSHPISFSVSTPKGSEAEQNDPDPSNT
jgi:hypothetical protein